MDADPIVDAVRAFFAAPVAPGIPYRHYPPGAWPCTDTRAALAGDEAARLRLIVNQYGPPEGGSYWRIEEFRRWEWPR